MAAALRLAGGGLGRVWPNPAVGCLISKDDKTVGRGWTQPGGRPHAEFEALQMAGAKAKGATAYVTLEPCAHEGETPSCARLLAEAGVKRVIFGSSGATQMQYEADEPIKAMVEARWDDVPSTRPLLTPQDPPRPNGIYGAAKLWGEALGRYYSDAHGMSVICIRIGRVVKEDWPYDARHAAVYCSHRDVLQMIEKCVSAPDSVRFDLFYAVSDNRGRYRDIEHAREVIGYVPQDGITDWPMERPG
ncbi:MAG: NAD-dependent epimerase/dehydratase family protein [Proteobacteria bacterium]|nr:NAD-dependent epimerase/dehydratase family protein [Pseudomonadota bacterium]